MLVQFFFLKKWHTFAQYLLGIVIVVVVVVEMVVEMVFKKFQVHFNMTNIESCDSEFDMT
jgi:hypothetical protein